MTRPLTLATLSITLAGALATSALAQPPRIVNGRVTTQPAGTLRSTFNGLVGAQADAGWVGYAAPAVDGERVMCCFDSGDGTSYMSGAMSSGRYCCGACRLEASAGGTTTNRTAAPTPANGPIALEAGSRMVVLFRIAAAKVEKVRVFSEDCQLDAGGRQVTWLDGVRAADSVALLESLATLPVPRSDHVMEGAVTAIALTGDPSADGALDRLAAVAQPEPLRRKVMFWLGNTRGAHGLATLQQVLKNDPSPEVKKAAVFGVSQSHEATAFTVLAGLARTDAEPKVRSEAVFWLAQKSDTRAAGVILEVLDKDPSSEVRKKAVFALSQLKDNAGVNALITTAKNSSDAQVRSEAIFWLGQKAGTAASSAITDRIDNDPNTEVKKRAVFALSQMPAADGVPLLINTARTNTNPEVRKQAMFWLGQSKDPKALAFFEEVLLKK
ncbi:MAG: HEAT repeat domain-containing protein [Vicinamibacterales bacterium]